MSARELDPDTEEFRYAVNIAAYWGSEAGQEERRRMQAPRPYYDDGQATLYHGDVLDVLRGLPDESVHCCVTSPPYYGLRAYLPDAHADKPLEIGLEDTPEAYVARLVAVFAEVRRVLRDDGTLWLNLGDSYNAYNGNRGDSTGIQKNSHAPLPDLPGGYGLTVKGLKPKDLLMIPARVALALQADGWWLRSDIIWAKRAPMPESVTDRPTSAHEHVFLLAKRDRYHYDADAVAEPSVSDHPSGNGYGRDERLSYGGRGQTQPWQVVPTRNQRNVWHLSPDPYPLAHFAVMPREIPRRAILAGCPEGGVTLDPFIGSGTTCEVAKSLGRKSIGIDLNVEYLDLARRRCQQLGLLFDLNEVTP